MCSDRVINNHPNKGRRLMRFAAGLSLLAWGSLCLNGMLMGAPAMASEPFAKTIKVSKEDGLTGQTLRVGMGRSVVMDFEEEVRDILISDPAIADAVVKTSRRVFIMGNSIGQASLFVFGNGGAQIATFNIMVEQDISDLEKILARMIPQAKIKVESIGGNLIVTGTAPSNADSQMAFDIASRFAAKQNNVPILNMISVTGKDQIHLKVTVAELERSVIKQLGVKLSGTIGMGRFGIGYNNSPALTVNSNVPLNDRFRIAPGFTSNSGKKILNGQLEALQREGIIRTLAEPTLTAVSGENASFLAGGEFPIPVAGNNGNISISFKTFGVGLDFTPVVLSGGMINLRVKTEVSEITQQGATTTGGISVPGLKVRRAESTLELPSGGTLVLAGLLQDSYKQDMNGIPGAMDVPVLGALFKSRDFQQRETELVVFVTPYIVKSSSMNELSDPRKNFIPPNDAASVFMNQLNRIYHGDNDGPAEGSYHGQVGYIYD